MRNTLIISLALALSLSACGKSEEAAQAPAAPEPPPAAEAPAPEAPAAEAPAAEAPPAEAPAAGAPEAAAPAAIDAGAKYASTCAGCHGPKGEGQGTFPKLAGQSADAIKGKLTSYKAGKQVGPQSAMMYPIAGGLSDEEIAALATHIAAF